jgi:hypothetical protein
MLLSPKWLSNGAKWRKMAHCLNDCGETSLEIRLGGILDRAASDFNSGPNAGVMLVQGAVTREMGADGSDHLLIWGTNRMIETA